MGRGGGCSGGGGGWREGKGIHRNWMSTAIISVSVIRVQKVFQTGVWFCYKCSRLVSGSVVSVPDRCLVLLSVFQTDWCLVLEDTRL